MDEAPKSFLTAVGMGVHGYVLKDAPATEIIAAVRGVFQGEALCPPKSFPDPFPASAAGVPPKGPRVAEHNAFLKFGLTYRQRQLVTLVGRGLSTKEIAANLHLSQFTMKNHIHRIMKQLDVQSRYEAVDLIRASGYLPDV
jgi:DNA-binding NarL/FixJ family response regulator